LDKLLAAMSRFRRLDEAIDQMQFTSLCISVDIKANRNSAAIGMS
jgi:hypothetical protein